MRLAAILLAAIGAAGLVLLVLYPPGMPEEDFAAPRPFARASLAAGVACVVVAAAAGRRPGGPPLVRALGHVAFVLGLLGASTAFREAMAVTARIGAAVTPADLAAEIDAMLASAISGAGAEALALGCAGALRLRPPRPPSPP